MFTKGLIRTGLAEILGYNEGRCVLFPAVCVAFCFYSVDGLFCSRLRSGGQTFPRVRFLLKEFVTIAQYVRG